MNTFNNNSNGGIGGIGGIGGTIPVPKFTSSGSSSGFPKPAVIGNKAEQQHQDLLHYVYSRVSSADADRQLRLRRYAAIDRAISTWQQLTQEDAERQLIEEHTGRVTGLPLNLPLLATSLDDTSAFFSEIFAPHARDFYVVPDGSEKGSAVWNLAKEMNKDTRFGGYYSQVSRTIRAMLKYNAGGMAVEWQAATENATAKNLYRSVDMYNVLWDNAVTYMPEIATRAEWVAEFRPMTRRELVDQLNSNGLIRNRVERILSADAGASAGAGTGWKQLFVRPPNHVGLSIDGYSTENRGKGNKSSGSGPDWSGYGLGDLAGELTSIPSHAFERHTIWIWLDPTDFGLTSGRSLQKYELWKLEIVNGIIAGAQPSVMIDQQEDSEAIPVFLSPYTDDDMGEAQRSTMEYMRGFQRFASFLMNIWILASRKSVYGITYYDGDVLDASKIKEGQVAGYVRLSTSGRDVRTALWKDTNSASVDNVIGMLTNMLNLTQQFFPNQALPAQIAGMDRAVKDQVSAVMAGGQARLRMQARILDTNQFLPTRKQAARNYLRGQPSGLAGLTEEEITSLLGGGIKSLSAERAVGAFRELLGLIGSSEQLTQVIDFPGLLNAFSEAMNLEIRLGDFITQPAAAAASTQP